MSGHRRPLLSQIDPRKVLIVSSSSWEADQLVGAFLSDRARPREIGADAIDVRRHPWLPGWWKGSDRAEPQALPRITVSLLRPARERRLWVRARLELWCLEDLIEPSAADPGPAELRRALSRVLSLAPAPDLLVTHGTLRAREGEVGRVLVQRDGPLSRQVVQGAVERVSGEVTSRQLCWFGGAGAPGIALGEAPGAVEATPLPARLVGAQSRWSSEPAVVEPGASTPTLVVSGLVGALGRPRLAGSSNRYGQELVAAHNAAVAVAWLAPTLVDALFVGEPLSPGFPLSAVAGGSV